MISGPFTWSQAPTSPAGTSAGGENGAGVVVISRSPVSKT